MGMRWGKLNWDSPERNVRRDWCCSTNQQKSNTSLPTLSPHRRSVSLTNQANPSNQTNLFPFLSFPFLSLYLSLSLFTLTSLSALLHNRDKVTDIDWESAWPTLLAMWGPVGGDCKRLEGERGLLALLSTFLYYVAEPFPRNVYPAHWEPDSNPAGDHPMPFYYVF